MSFLIDSLTRESFKVIISYLVTRVMSDTMIRDLDCEINEDLINFVIVYQTAVRFPIYTPSEDSLIIRVSSCHSL